MGGEEREVLLYFCRNLHGFTILRNRCLHFDAMSSLKPILKFLIFTNRTDAQNITLETLCTSIIGIAVFQKCTIPIGSILIPLR